MKHIRTSAVTTYMSTRKQQHLQLTHQRHHQLKHIVAPQLNSELINHLSFYHTYKRSMLHTIHHHFVSYITHTTLHTTSCNTCAHTADDSVFVDEQVVLLHRKDSLTGEHLGKRCPTLYLTGKRGRTQHKQQLHVFNIGDMLLITYFITFIVNYFKNMYDLCFVTVSEDLSYILEFKMRIRILRVVQYRTDG